MTTSQLIPKFRTAYDGLQKAVSLETSIDFGDEKSLAQQNFAEECDINNIVARFAQTGELPTNVTMPRYGDVSLVPDYQESLHIVMNADLAFQSLSAEVRDRFKNDPLRFLEFMSNAENEAEARKLGLLNPAEGSQHDPPPNPEAQAAPAAPSASTPSE